MHDDLARLRTDELQAILDEHSVVALVPVGSVEPHGPHLPLATDTLISQGVAREAAARLKTDAVRALVCPALPYGVTDFASGFAGAISIPKAPLVAFVRAMAQAYLDGGFAHVCLINNHLEPDQDAAMREAAATFPPGQVSVACPLTRRWGRTLSAEYKSGCCHAGEYETSLILAVAPDTVAKDTAQSLPDIDVSLSDGIRAGKHTFREMGLDRAYTGAPAAATAEEGRRMIALLTEMVVTEVTEALAAPSA